MSISTACLVKSCTPFACYTEYQIYLIHSTHKRNTLTGEPTHSWQKLHNRTHDYILHIAGLYPILLQQAFDEKLYSIQIPGAVFCFSGLLIKYNLHTSCPPPETVLVACEHRIKKILNPGEFWNKGKCPLWRTYSHYHYYACSFPQLSTLPQYL